MERRRPSRWRLILVITLFALSCCGPFKGMFTGPDDIKIANPIRAVSDARQLIKEQRANPDEDKVLREPEELPESLRLPGLRYALVHEDHVDLVLVRNPDWRIGGQIWSLDAKRKHADKPTKYPEVFYYDYNNDAEESPDNIP